MSTIGHINNDMTGMEGNLDGSTFVSKVQEKLISWGSKNK